MYRPRTWGEDNTWLESNPPKTRNLGWGNRMETHYVHTDFICHINRVNIYKSQQYKDKFNRERVQIINSSTDKLTLFLFGTMPHLIEVVKLHYDQNESLDRRQIISYVFSMSCRPVTRERCKLCDWVSTVLKVSLTEKCDLVRKTLISTPGVRVF